MPNLPGEVHVHGSKIQHFLGGYAITTIMFCQCFSRKSTPVLNRRKHSWPLWKKFNNAVHLRKSCYLLWGFEGSWGPGFEWNIKKLQGFKDLAESYPLCLDVYW